MDFRFHTPVTVCFGAGKAAATGELAQGLGERALVVTMGDLVDSGAAKTVTASLERAGITPVLYADAQPEPKTDGMEAAVAACREARCDFVIGLGGGSAIDTAKAVAIGATHPEPVWEYVNLSNRPPQPVSIADTLPIVAVPTTAGTGAEVTPYAVVTNAETTQKGTIKEEAIYPRVSIIDPELTLSLPKELTGATGVDAFAHAMESYFNVPNRSPFSDMIVEEALTSIIRWLPAAYADGCDLEARAGVMWGATLAGMAISQAGTTVVHAMAQPLGARLGVPHAQAVAVFLSAVMRNTLPAEEERFAKLLNCFPNVDAADGDVSGRAAMMIERMEAFVRDVGMGTGLRAYGAGDSLADELADDVTSYMSRPLQQHPKLFDKEALRRIVAESM